MLREMPGGSLSSSLQPCPSGIKHWSGLAFIDFKVLLTTVFKSWWKNEGIKRDGWCLVLISLTWILPCLGLVSLDPETQRRPSDRSLLHPERRLSLLCPGSDVNSRGLPLVTVQSGGGWGRTAILIQLFTI